ncbi:MAG: V-type ATP synthase subunit I, partial [Rikenellaceae bacterium]|nr:V-type ATP synthase subunit I [Rikenellaceae bacterium]
MMKYSFVLHHTDSEAFLNRLQELGLVDIDSGQWTPDERERGLLADAECQARAMKDLDKRRKGKNREAVTPFGSARETLDRYTEASARIEAIDQAMARLTKEITELTPWGDFPAASIRALEEQGISLHFFTTYANDFEKYAPGWREKYIVDLVSEVDGMACFVVVTTPESAPLAIEALSVKTPAASRADKEIEVIGLQNERKEMEAILERCAEGFPALESLGNELRAELQLSRVSKTAAREADGSLAVMTGWATKDAARPVDAFLDTHPAVIFFKDEPTEEDDPPVLLKNNAFAGLFEVIANLYALPKYGTMDLTAYFAPFYMLFFGFCLADAGYGLIYVAAASLLYRRVKPAFRPILKL